MSAHGTVTEVVTPTLNGQSLKNININSSGQYDHAITSDGNYQINLPVSTSSGASAPPMICSISRSSTQAP